VSELPVSEAVKFGTSGVRGLVDRLLGGDAGIYTRAFIEHLQRSGLVGEGGSIAVGEDLRPSSAAIGEAVCEAISQAGLMPVRCGVVPTPALACFAIGRGMAAIMVTGSHIPADRNGLKFYRPDGEIDKQDEAAIVQILAEQSSHAVDVRSTGEVAAAEADALAPYRDRYRGFLPNAALAGRRVGIWEQSSVARSLLAEIVTSSGGEPVLFGRSAQFVPVDTEALGATDAARLAAWVESERLDLMISTDADADRPLVIDEKGRQVRGDALGLIAAKFLNAGSVVTPVTSSSGIEAGLSAPVLRTRVGSPFVIAGMAEAVSAGHRNVVGFEANGGFLTGSDIIYSGHVLPALPTRDALLPILCMFIAMGETGAAASEVISGLGLPVALSDRLQNYPVAKGQALMRQLADDAAFCEQFLDGLGAVEGKDATDGVKFFLAEGKIVHFRPSGNAPEMRCYVEAPNRDAAEALLTEGLRRVKAFAPVGVEH
jgi:phosphomannomutase